MDALSSGKVVQTASYQVMITHQAAEGDRVISGFGLYPSQTPYELQLFFYGGLIGYVSVMFSYLEKGVTILILSNTVASITKMVELVDALVPALVP